MTTKEAFVELLRPIAEKLKQSNQRRSTTQSKHRQTLE